METEPATVSLPGPSQEMVEIAREWLEGPRQGGIYGTRDNAINGLAQLLTETRTKALEEAAAIADGYRNAQSPVGVLHGIGIGTAAKWIGERIRSLKV